MKMNKYTVQSFLKLEFDPCDCGDIEDEAYFDTMDQCEDWCNGHFDIKHLNFKIHHNIGARNYRLGVASRMGTITWRTKDYPKLEAPQVSAWWSIFDVPEEVDQQLA